MKLYEIDAAIAACIDEETGEVIDCEKLVALNMEREQKIESIALWYKNDVAEAAAIREEEKALAERRRKLERSAESKKAFLDRLLGGAKFSTARCAVSYRKSQRVEVEDMGRAVTWLLAHDHAEAVDIPAPTASKTAIAAILKSGEAVDGAELVSGLSMAIK